MFERAGCPWCQRWDREVGASYMKSDEARRLPLRRVDIDARTKAGIALLSPVIFTPTFVVVDDGREVGRITGYINDDMFWGLLTALAAKLKPARSAGQT
jgi:thioredoxin-related protein